MSKQSGSSLQNSILSQRDWWLLLALVLLHFCLRLYKITNPIADWHAFRQADTASVTREYVKHGVQLLEPRYQDLSNIQSGKDNLEGYRMVEFPMVNAGLAQLIRWWPWLPLDLTSRVASVVASLVTLLALFGLVLHHGSKDRAFLAAAFFAVLPYSMYYSRAVLPEPFMLAASTLSLFAFDSWLRTGKWPWWLLSAVSLSAALLLKPFVAFLGLAYLALLFQHRHQLKKVSVWLALVVFAAIAGLPLLWWRKWIEQFPSGIPASDWLLNGNGIRLRPAWWRWLGYERLTKLITGYVGMLWLAVAAVVTVKNWKTELVYIGWGVGLFAYLAVVASGNVQHDYYQVLLTPFVCVAMAIGAIQLFQVLEKKIGCRPSQLLVAVMIVAGWWLSWQQVKGYYNVNHWEYVEAGAAVDQLVPADAKVIAPAFGDTHFLYQTNRTGWPIGFEIEDKRAKGATFYVTTSDDDEARELLTKYPLFQKGKRYQIIDLRQPLSSTPSAATMAR